MLKLLLVDISIFFFYLDVQCALNERNANKSESEIMHEQKAKKK